MVVETRQAWDKSARLLVEGGYAVLTLDLRGQGKSGGKPDWVQSIADVQRVWESFSQHKNVDRSRTAFIGSSNGANIALNAAVALPQVRTAVLISPHLNFMGVTTNDALPKLGQRTILVISGESDPISGDWPARMQTLASGQVTLKTVPTQEHGTYLLAGEPQMLNVIQKWLDDRLVNPRDTAETGRFDIWPFVFILLTCTASIVLLIASLALLHGMLRSSLKTSPPLPVAQLHAGMPEVEIRGKVARVNTPLDLPWDAGVAAVYLRVEKTTNSAWAVIKETGTASTFLLEDRSGSILVEGAPAGLALTGDPIRPSKTQLETLLPLLGLEDLQANADQYRFTLWQITSGQMAALTGSPWRRPHLLPTRIKVADNSQTSLATAALRPEQQAVTIQGRISAVLEPLDDNPDHPLALRRAVIEEVDPHFNRVVIFEQWFVSDFRLQDNYGDIWIRPDPNLLALDLPAQELSLADFKELVDDPILEQLSPASTYHYRVYDLRSGAVLAVQGNVTEERLTFIARQADGSPSAAPLVPVKSLRPGQGRVRLAGTIVEIEAPLDGKTSAGKKPSLAVLRIDSEETTRQGTTLFPSKISASAFRLQDSTSSVWVFPENPVGDCLGPGLQPTWSHLESALRFMGEDPASWKNRNCTLWELRLGQTVTVSGVVSNQRAGMHNRPRLELVPSDQGILPRLKYWRPTMGQAGLLLPLLGLGLSLLCISMVQLAVALRQLLN